MVIWQIPCFKGKRMIENPVFTWLMDPSEPSLRYRTLVELLDTPLDDPKVVATRQSIPQSSFVIQLMGKMHPEGYWLQTNPRTGRSVGEGVEYGSFATTHFCLAYLAEFGLDHTHPQVALASERYLGLQRPDGDWRGHYSCLYGYNIRTFVMLGYRNDVRVQRSIELLERSGRPDGGYLCDFHEPKSLRSKSKPKSCIRGSLKALAAYSELGQEYWTHPGCLKLIDYFLRREGIYQRTQPEKLVNRDVATMIFPFHWRAGLVEILYHLSRMGHGNDPRLERAWMLLDSKTDKEGCYILEWTPTQSPWKVGKRGLANKWMTFYALLAKKKAGRDS
jgi:hypothetical protein